MWDEIGKGIAQKMPDQLIPVVNECFHRSYPPNVRIEFLSTEYVQLYEKDGHPYPRILADITFQVDRKEIYHLEFQVNDDKTITIRMLEYDLQIGLQHDISVEGDASGLTVKFPHSAIICPVGGKNMPVEMTCNLEFPDGTIHTYKVPVIKISDYRLSELFEKRLNLFLPFSLLRFRDRLRRLEKKSPENIRKELTDFLEELILGLETEFNQGIISEWQYKEYLKLVRMASNRVLHGHRELREEAANMTECKLKFLSDMVEEHAQELAQELAQDMLAEQAAEISEKDAKLSEKDARIAELERQLAALKGE